MFILSLDIKSVKNVNYIFGVKLFIQYDYKHMEELSVVDFLALIFWPKIRFRNSVAELFITLQGSDIAILKLDKELNFNEYVQAACLPDPHMGENEALVAIISGWGSTEHGMC